MLALHYTCDLNNVNGTVLLEIEETHINLPYVTPLNFSLKNSISGDEIWNGTFNNPGDWSSFPFGAHSEAEVKDGLGNTILNWKWDPALHGDPICKFFNAWAIKNQGAFGIAIGTHDGSSGEWVEPVRSGLLESFLVEASDKQFNLLQKNYTGLEGVYLYKSLITPYGGDVSFFELGEGHVNSVKLEHVQQYSDESDLQIVEKKMRSISILELFQNLESDKQIKWLHLDTEGLDAELIFALLNHNVVLPEVIIYESLNLSNDVRSDLLQKLSFLGYQILEYGWNTLAYGKNTDG